MIVLNRTIIERDKLRYISLSALIENILQVLQLIKNFFSQSSVLERNRTVSKS